MENSTPAFLRTLATAVLTFLFRSSKEAMQPIQRRVSAGESAIVLMSRPSAQSALVSHPIGQGLKFLSMFWKNCMSSCGNLLSIRTRFLLMSTILSRTSSRTGQTSWHALHVVQAHISSSFTTSPGIGGLSTSPRFPSFSPTSFGPTSSRWSRRSWRTFFGLSGLSVVEAGHAS